MLSARLDLLSVLPCVAAGAAVAVLILWMIAALRTGDLAQTDQWRYDISRINELRRRDALFRVFQPLIQWLARLNRGAFATSLPRIEREIQTAGLPRFWLPEEYLAKLQLMALLISPMYFLLSIQRIGAAGVISGIGLTGATVWFLRHRLTRLARRRLMDIKRRLPFMLDLMTLLMEAGSSFLQSLKQAVNEFQGHAIAVEFGRVLTDMNMGKPRVEAFNNLRDRLGDEEISSIVGSILQSEELGTPLSDVFRTQADVLRIKRSQRAETIAGEAGVNMLLPGILVMAATVLCILGPFVLNFFLTGL